MHYLWFDTETGGLDPKVHSLLTAYFRICDDELNFVDDLYLQLKPSDIQKLTVTAEAMEINGINLQEHLSDPNTHTYEEGKEILVSFLEKHKIKGKRKSFRPAGHNVQFDKDMIWAQLIPQDEWEKLVHYRTLDTSIITNFLKDIDYIPQDLGNLTSLAEYFKVPMKEAHNAKNDVLMNIEVYREIVTLFKHARKNFAGNQSNSGLLEIIES